MAPCHKATLPSSSPHPHSSEAHPHHTHRNKNGLGQFALFYPLPASLFGPLMGQIPGPILGFPIIFMKLFFSYGDSFLTPISAHFLGNFWAIWIFILFNFPFFETFFFLCKGLIYGPTIWAFFLGFSISISTSNLQNP